MSSPVKTTCKHCVFAAKDLGVQVGCVLGKLETFKNRGEAEYIEDDHCYQINRVCKFCRVEEWMIPLEDMYKEIKDETFIPVDFVIVDEGKSGLKLDDMLDCLACSFETAVEYQTRPVNRFILVTNNPNMEDKDYIGWLNAQKFSSWYLIRNFEDNPTYGSLLDMGVKRCTGKYFIHSDIGFSFPNMLVEALNNGINEKLEQVIYVRDEPECILTQMYRNIGGMKGASIEDKIRSLAEEQKNEHTIKRWSDLCQI